MKKYSKQQFRVGTPRITKTAYGDVLSYVAGPYIPYPDYESLEGYISLLNKVFEEYDERFGGEYSDLQIGSEVDCGCPCDCSCSPTLYLVGLREPTQLEKDFYDDCAAKEKEKKEARDRAEYERLKKEFEG